MRKNINNKEKTWSLRRKIILIITVFLLFVIFGGSIYLSNVLFSDSESNTVSPTNVALDKDSFFDTSLLASQNNGATFNISINNKTNNKIIISDVKIYINSKKIENISEINTSFNSFSDELFDKEIFEISNFNNQSEVPANSKKNLLLSISQNEASGYFQSAGVYSIKSVVKTQNKLSKESYTTLSYDLKNTLNKTYIKPIVPITLPNSIVGLASEAQVEELTSKNGTLSLALNFAEKYNAIIAIDPKVIASVKLFNNDKSNSFQWLLRLKNLLDTHKGFYLEAADGDMLTQLEVSGNVYKPSSSIRVGSSVATEGKVYSWDEISSFDKELENIYWSTLNSLSPENYKKLNDIKKYDTIILSDRDIKNVVKKNSYQNYFESNNMILTSSYTEEKINELIRLNSELNPDFISDLKNSKKEEFKNSLLIAENDINNINYAEISVGIDRSNFDSTTKYETIMELFDSISGLKYQKTNSLEIGKNYSVHDLNYVPISQDVLDMYKQGIQEEKELNEYSSIALYPDVVINDNRWNLLNLFSSKYSKNNSLLNEISSTYFSNSIYMKNSTGILISQDLVLISSKADIPVQINNNLIYPIKIYLKALPINKNIEITNNKKFEIIEPNSQKIIKLPTTVNITTGDTGIWFNINDSDGKRVTSPVFQHISIQVSFEHYLTIIFISVISISLLLGVIRSLKRKNGINKR